MKGNSSGSARSKILERTRSFGLPLLVPLLLECRNNICRLHMGARIPLTSINLAGEVIIGYNVVNENTISGEGRLIYNSTGKVASFGLRLSIVLEGVDELEIKLDVICGKDERAYSIGGTLGTDLPAICVPMPATPQYFMFCITIGDYRYFHDDRLIICLRAEIQFCEYRVVTLLYKCLNFTKYSVKAINQKLKTVSIFSKNQYDAARQTLRSISSLRSNMIEEKDEVNDESSSE